MAHKDPKGEGKEAFPEQIELCYEEHDALSRGRRERTSPRSVEGLLDTLNGAGRVAITGDAEAEILETEFVATVHDSDIERVEPGTDEVDNESAKSAQIPLSQEWLEYQLLKLLLAAGEEGMRRADAKTVVLAYSASNKLKLNASATGQLFLNAMYRILDTYPQVIRVGGKSTSHYICTGVVELPEGFGNTVIGHIEPEPNPSSPEDFTQLNSRMVASINHAGSAGATVTQLRGVVSEYLVENDRGVSENNVSRIFSLAKKCMTELLSGEVVRINGVYLAAEHIAHYTEQRKPAPKPVKERVQKPKPVKNAALKAPKQIKRAPKATETEPTVTEDIEENVPPVNNEIAQPAELFAAAEADDVLEILEVDDVEVDEPDMAEVDEELEVKAADMAEIREQERLERLEQIAATIVKPSKINAQYLGVSIRPSREDNATTLVCIGETEFPIPVMDAHLLAKIMREKSSGIVFDKLIKYLQIYSPSYSGTRLFDTLLALDADVLMPNGFHVHRDGARSPILRLREYHPEVAEVETDFVSVPTGKLKKAAADKAIASFLISHGDYDERLDHTIGNMTGSELIALVDSFELGKLSYDAARLSIIIDTASEVARRELKTYRRALAS